MGDFATSTQTAKQNGTEKSTAATDPWGPQSSFLKDIFGQAQDINQNQPDPYTGDFVAQFNPQQLDMFKSMVNYANTSPIAGMLANQGANLGALGTSGVASGMQGLKDYRPSGTTQGTIADAGLYADNPYISGMVDAATRDASRTLNEQTLPGISRDAALSGNTNSSKTSIRQGIADRGLQDLRGDVSSNLRGQAYSQGLNLSQNQSQFNDTSMLDRAKALSDLGISAGSLGSANLTGSLGAQGSLFDMGNQGASGLQAADQAALDNAIAKYQFNQSDPWTSLMNYYNIIGNKSWGGNVQSTGKTNQVTNSSSTASPAAAIGGILTGIGSLIPGKQ